MKILSILKHFLLNNDRLDFLHQGPNGKHEICGGWLDWKTIISDPSLRIPIVRFSQTNLIFFWSVPIVKLKFLSNYRYDFSKQGLHWKISACGGQFNQQTFCFDPCIGFMTVQILQKMLFSFRSKFKLLILNHYKFDFLHEELGQKLNTCRRPVNKNIIVFLLASESW